MDATDGAAQREHRSLHPFPALQQVPGILRLAPDEAAADVHHLGGQDPGPPPRRVRGQAGEQFVTDQQAGEVVAEQRGFQAAGQPQRAHREQLVAEFARRTGARRLHARLLRRRGRLGRRALERAAQVLLVGQERLRAPAPRGIDALVDVDLGGDQHEGERGAVQQDQRRTRTRFDIAQRKTVNGGEPVVETGGNAVHLPVLFVGYVEPVTVRIGDLQLADRGFREEG